MFRRHIARFISLVAMVVISIGFVSGIGSAADKIDYSLDNYYRNQNVSDFIIKSKSATGFTDEEINNLRAYFEGADIDGGMSIDLPVNAEEKLSLRLYFLDFENWTVNVPALIDGKAPETVLEAYCEQSDDVIKGYSVGEEVDLSPYGFALKVKISGVIQSPLTFNLGGEPSYNNKIILAGDTVCRRAVTPPLRRFIRYVMPAIFPSMMTRGGQASLSIPFEMIVTPIAFPKVH